VIIVLMARGRSSRGARPRGGGHEAKAKDADAKATDADYGGGDREQGGGGGGGDEDKESREKGDDDSRLEDSQADLTCQFCGLHDPAWADGNKLDLHYFQDCPVLTACKSCGQVGVGGRGLGQAARCPAVSHADSPPRAPTNH
jgi:hypothetical protein